MTYIEGFVIPCPAANKTAYAEHAARVAAMFQGLGAARTVQAWGEDVPDGKINDLKQAVQARPDEAILFSWMEFPDRAARDAAVEGSRAFARPDDLPFDPQRMIVSGFDVISDAGPGGAPGFIDGVILPVPEAKRADYTDFAKRFADLFVDYGATRVVDAWGADLMDGKQTDYKRAACVEPGETVVYSWIEWPSRPVRDDAWERVMQDERMQNQGDRPFDGKRMMFGGFTPIVDTGA